MKELVLKYLYYNLWANRKVVDYLNKKPQEDLDVAIPSSFPSLRKTILHIWDAEILWLARLQDGHFPHLPGKHFSGSNYEMFEGLLQASENFIRLCEPQDALFFQKKHSFLTLSDGETTQSCSDMIHHCMNHSTYHRGQLITMMRQLGYTDPPHLDFLVYLFSLNSPKNGQ